MSELKKSVLYNQHINAGAKMTEFGGWEMPIQYSSGIITEHLTTRKAAGIFDVSHMGRFIFAGSDSLGFLQHVLTNNAAGLSVGEAQYTIIQNETGGAIDDAYLYRFEADEWVLVVNAANREKDWNHFYNHLGSFPDVSIQDYTDRIAMISLQGPKSRDILNKIITKGAIPEPIRNSLSCGELASIPVKMARTGYTGEPICFELFVGSEQAVKLWRLLEEEGALPIGLGARDTLRLEAGMPLYGHELGADPDGDEIPIYAIGLAGFAVSLSPFKGNFIGREALTLQQSAKKKIIQQDFSEIQNVPKRVRPFAITGKGLAREGSRVFINNKEVGWVTSGTSIPYWVPKGQGIETVLTEESSKRAIGLAYIDSNILKGAKVEIEVRNKMIEAEIVPVHIRSEAPPFCYPIVAEDVLDVDGVLAKSKPEDGEEISGNYRSSALNLIKSAMDNTIWRQRECLNLIPSEMTASVFSRLLSIMDPVSRYAEHKKVKAFGEDEVFYYQGTEFIHKVETLLNEEMAKFLGCSRIESRVISGQMANTAVFSAMLDYINRGNRKSEPVRMSSVMNNHIIRGGHLSAQPMGALKDFIARDPKTEQPAVINFPVLPDNPYKMDIEGCKTLLEEYRPELIILGKSMIIHKEPVTEFRKYIDELELDSILMYDMAHVLGLVGPHFQNPFDEGADLVTGSTHKTFFGTQRGIIGGNFQENDKECLLWQAIERRAFPGSVSNHHLGTLLGLLMSTYEMNAFKNDYQEQIIKNAKAFARALSDTGLTVAGDPLIDFTETHQVIVEVGWTRGAEIAKRLEENNIIVNYQATPFEEGFSASGAIRLGVSEMTRFGMEEDDFRIAAGYIAEIILGNKVVKDDAKAFRQKFLDMGYCFKGTEFDSVLEDLGKLL
ncbi:MAG: glycine cleavage system aminomethyltransferase GcvT [Spirochaetales bacterium]|nr:glycine cleavage system aminomethyltransferase GcvT [Spirochaetales bacterium]